METGLFRKFFIIYFATFICFSSIAQNNKIERRIKVENIIYKKNHFSFSLIPQLVQKAKIARTTGTYELRSSVQRGIEIGFNYHVNLKKNLSIIFGLHGGVSFRNYILHIPGGDFTPPLNYDYDDNGAPTREGDFYLSVPMFFEKRWIYSERKFLNFNLGFNVRFSLSEAGESIGAYIHDNNGNIIHVYEMNLEVGHNSKPWIDYNIGGGHSWILGNYNILQVKLLMNFSSTSLTKGTYKITVPGKPDTEGTYKGRLSFMGLSFNYVLTGANKTLRKMYEQRQL